jgi:hypothetical protein
VSHHTSRCSSAFDHGRSDLAETRSVIILENIAQTYAFSSLMLWLGRCSWWFLISKCLLLLFSRGSPIFPLMTSGFSIIIPQQSRIILGSPHSLTINTTTINQKQQHGQQRRFCISAAIEETSGYAIDQQKGEKQRGRSDRSTTTLKAPTKSQRVYLHSSNSTSSIIQHSKIAWAS